MSDERAFGARSFRERGGTISVCQISATSGWFPFASCRAGCRENRSLLECIREAGPDLTDDDRGTEVIERYLRANPELVTDWQRESDDTRGSPNHYVNEREVGFYDAGFHDRTTHDDEVGACADFCTARQPGSSAGVACGKSAPERRSDLPICRSALVVLRPPQCLRRERRPGNLARMADEHELVAHAGSEPRRAPPSRRLLFRSYVAVGMVTILAVTLFGPGWTLWLPLATVFGLSAGGSAARSASMAGRSLIGRPTAHSCRSAPSS